MNREMEREDAIEVVYEAMDRIQDMDTTLRMYAGAAVDALGWKPLAVTSMPDIDQVVVCTDGNARWLDKITDFDPKLKWDGHIATHWHAIQEFKPA